MSEIKYPEHAKINRKDFKEIREFILYLNDVMQDKTFSDIPNFHNFCFESLYNYFGTSNAKLEPERLRMLDELKK